MGSQQDAATPHTAGPIMGLSRQIFGEHFIFKRFAIEYPTRNPNLTTLDSYLWGYFINAVNIGLEVESF